MDKEKTLRKLKQEIEEVWEKFGVEFAEVVRCKDCKWWEDGWLGYCTKCHSAIPYDGFCSYGERRDSDG